MWNSIRLVLRSAKRPFVSIMKLSPAAELREPQPVCTAMGAISDLGIRSAFTPTNETGCVSVEKRFAFFCFFPNFIF